MPRESREALHNQFDWIAERKERRRHSEWHSSESGSNGARNDGNPRRRGHQSVMNNLNMAGGTPKPVLPTPSRDVRNKNVILPFGSILVVHVSAEISFYHPVLGYTK
jgi:hypothetical protein